MTKTWSTNALLFLIVIALFLLALRPYREPRTAHASNGDVYPFYVEPGTQMLRAPDGSRAVLGKVMIDMRSGQVWGFPTNTPDPYPSNGMSSKPQVSRPFVLGKFAFEDTAK